MTELQPTMPRCQSTFAVVPCEHFLQCQLPEGHGYHHRYRTEWAQVEWEHHES